MERRDFVRKVDENSAVINVDGGEYTVSMRRCVNVDNKGLTLGGRSQIPLGLHFASTVHKAQGLSTPPNDFNYVDVFLSYERT